MRLQRLPIWRNLYILHTHCNGNISWAKCSFIIIIIKSNHLAQHHLHHLPPHHPDDDDHQHHGNLDGAGCVQPTAQQHKREQQKRWRSGLQVIIMMMMMVMIVIIMMMMVIMVMVMMLMLISIEFSFEGLLNANLHTERYTLHMLVFFYGGIVINIRPAPIAYRWPVYLYSYLYLYPHVFVFSVFFVFVSAGLVFFYSGIVICTIAYRWPLCWMAVVVYILNMARTRLFALR